MSDPILVTNGHLTGSQEQDKVCSALCAAQAEMPAAEFDSSNPYFKSRYASLGAVISASQPVLKAHGLAVFQPSETDGTTVKVHTRIVHTSGQWLDGGTLTIPIGEPKGNSLVQEVGKIVTYLRRYGWSSAIGMYADEDTDGNDHKPPAKEKTVTYPVKPEKPAEVPPEKADAATRLRALNLLQSAPGQLNRDIFTAFLRFKGWTPPKGEAEDWALEHIPLTKKGLTALAAEVNQWDIDRHQPADNLPM